MFKLIFSGKTYLVNDILSINCNELKDQFFQDICKFIQQFLNKKNKTIICYSSGSTGIAKPIKIKKQHMINSAELTAKTIGLHSDNTAVLCLPISYIAGKMMLVRSLHFGLKLYAIKPKSILNGNLKADFIALTIYQAKLNLVKFKNFQKIIIGGGAITNNLAKQLIEISQQFNLDIYTSYGMTETCSHIALTKLDNKLLTNNYLNNNKNPLPIINFKPLTGIKINKNKQDCLVIKAPKLTNETIITKDLVEINSDNSFYIKGRLDNLINSAGVKIIPELVEKKIHDLINDKFFIAGIKDNLLGQKPIIFIEYQQNKYSKQKIDKLLLSINKRTNYKYYLKDIYFIKFKFTKSGKINRMSTIKNYSVL